METSYQSLINAITSHTAWTNALKIGRATQQKYPTAKLRDVIRLAPKPPELWFYFTNDKTVGANSPDLPNIINTLYNITTDGILTADPSIAPRVTDEQTCEQAHVWLAASIPHSNSKSRDPDLHPRTPGDTPETQKPIPLRTSGIIADWDVLLKRSKPARQPAPVGSNPANFAYYYGPVDTPPGPVACSGADVFHLHWLQESYQWTPPRTLDPDHNPPTSHGTTWIELLNQPNTSITTIRGAMIRPRISLGLSPSLKDTMYRVQMDAFLIGPRRCLKPLPTKGICDLCWYQDGIRTPENIKHILMECPHSSPTISAHLRLLACCASRRGSQEATQMPTQTFLQTFARRIIFGCIDFEPAQFRCPPEVVVTLAAAVQQCTLKRRDSNAHPTILGSPPESSPSTLLNNIIARFSLAASSTYIKAKQENDRHQIFYPDRPSKEIPIEKLTKIWVESGAVRITNNGRLYSILIPTPNIPTLHHMPPPNPGFGPGPGPGPDPGPGPGPGHDSDPSTDTDATESDTDTDTNPDSDHNTEYESDSSQPATTSPHQIHKITLQHTQKNTTTSPPKTNTKNGEENITNKSNLPVTTTKPSPTFQHRFPCFTLSSDETIGNEPPVATTHRTTIDTSPLLVLTPNSRAAAANARIAHRGHPLTPNPLLAMSSNPPPSVSQHRLDRLLPSSTETSRKFHATRAGQITQPPVPRPLLGAEFALPYPQAPAIWANQSPTQPFNTDLRIEERTLSFLDTWDTAEVVNHRINDPDFTGPKQHLLLTNLKRFLKTPRQNIGIWAHLNNTHRCPVSSPYPVGRITSSIKFSPLPNYLQACLFRSSAVLAMINAKSRCFLWACCCFNIETPYLKQYVNNRDGPDTILQQIMQESNLSRNEAKDKCTKTWTETAYLTLTGSNKNLSFLYLLDREAKVARKDLSRISDLAWLIPAHAPHTINSTLGRFAIRIYNLLETRILISVKDALETVNHTVAAIINDGILLQNGALTTNTRIVKIARTTSESICPGINMLWAWKPHAPNITTDTGKILGGPLKVPRAKPSPPTHFPIHHPSPTPILIPCTTLMTLTQSPPPAIQTHNTQRNQPQPPIRILKPNTQANHHIPPRPQQTNSIPNDTLAHIAEILFNPPNIYSVAVTSRDNTTVVVTSRDNTTVVAQCDNTPRRSG